MVSLAAMFDVKKKLLRGPPDLNFMTEVLVSEQMNLISEPLNGAFDRSTLIYQEEVGRGRCKGGHWIQSNSNHKIIEIT